MALIYTRSTAKSAKGYSRSDNMESNPGVATLAIVNPGKPIGRNPYQWISGRGTKHKHVSPSYKSLEGATKWGRSRPETKAKLYPTDDRGTVLGRPISRRQQMAYNIGALRRNRKTRRSQPSVAHYSDILKAARAVERRSSKSGRRRTRRARSSVTARSERVTMPGKRRSRSRSRKSSKRSRAAKKAARTRAAKKLARSLSARKAARSRKRRSGKKTSKRSKRRSSKRRSSKRAGKRRSSKRRSSKRRASKRRSSKRRSTKGRRRRSRRTSRKGYYYGGRRIGSPGVKGLESWFKRGMAPQMTRVPRLFNRPRVTSWKYGAHLAKISRHGSRRRRRSGRRTSRKTSRKMAANRRRRSRRSRRRGSMAANRRRRRRRSSMKANRRRRRRLSRNMLAQRTGRGRGGRTSGRGKLMQVVQLGPRSRRRGYPVTVAQHTLSNAYVRRFKFGGIARSKHLAKRGSMAANRRRRRTSRRVSRNAYVLLKNRRRRHSRRVSRNISQAAANPRRRRRRHSMKANRRRRRRHSMKANRRRSRRLRRNSVLGISTSDISSILKPTIAGAAGFVGARFVGNLAQKIPFVANLGPWGGVLTDVALMGITLAMGRKIPVVGSTVGQNQGALVVGMGLDAVHRILGLVHVPILSEVMATALPIRSVVPPATAGFGAYVDVSHAGAPYKGMLGTGEYVESSMGEYVEQPMGEYVEAPMGDSGIFSANVFDGMTGG